MIPLIEFEGWWSGEGGSRVKQYPNQNLLKQMVNHLREILTLKMLKEIIAKLCGVSYEPLSWSFTHHPNVTFYIHSSFTNVIHSSICNML